MRLGNFISALWLMSAIFCGAAEEEVVCQWIMPEDAAKVKGFHFKNFIDGAGVTEYDPNMSFKLPGILDAKKINRIRLQLSSSSADDAISIVYNAPNGDWCLGSADLIRAGKHEYVINTDDINWKAGQGSSAAAAKWGGSEGKIAALRFDPGNSAGRQVKLHRLSLNHAEKVWPSSWRFDSSGAQGWRIENARKIIFSDAEGLMLDTGNNTYLFSPAMDLDADTYSEMEVELKAGENCNVAIYFKNADNFYAEARKLKFSVPASSQYRKFRINCRNSPQWKGQIAAFRFDPGSVLGNSVSIRSIEFKKSSIGVLPNDTFENADGANAGKPEFWTGDVTLNRAGKGAVLAGKGAMRSATVEIIDNEPLLIAVNGGKGGEFSLEFFDIFKRPLAQQQLTSPGEKRIEMPNEAAFFRIGAVNPGTEPVVLESVIASFVPRPRANWTGKWIWNEFIGEKTSYSALFVKEFDIADPEKIDRATLQGTADDALEILLNGKELTGPNSRNWGAPDSFDVKPYLKKGKNTLRIHAINGGASAGMVAELQYRTSDGIMHTIASDRSFDTYHLTKEMDFKTVDLDGLTKDQTVVMAEVGNPPWGALPFLPLGAIDGVFAVTGLPDKADENSRGTAHATLEFAQGTELFKGKRINFSLWLKSDRNKILIYEKELDGNQIQNQVSLEDIKFDFRYLPDGIYQLLPELELGVLKMEPMELTMKRQAPIIMPTVKIIDRDSVPKLEINGSEIVYPAAHLATMDQTVPNYRQIKNAADNGIEGIWLHYSSWRYRDGGKDFNFDNLDNMCANILARNPDAHIMLCVYVDSVGIFDMRKNWNPENNEELARMENGSTAIRNYSDDPEESPSMASKKYLAEGDRVLTALYQHLRKQPYGERVVGILPSSGLTWEWMYWGSQKGDFADYSKPFQQAFREWAMAKYGSLEAANRSWKKSFPQIDSIVIPSVKERKSVDFLDLRRPSETQYLIDFQEFMSNVVADAVLHFAGTVKKVSDRKLLAGAYYGYTNFLIRSSLAHNTGHFALGKVLKSPDFDLQNAPSRYFDREVGGAGGFMMPEASAALHGKLCVTENDIRTVHANNPIGKVDTLQGSRAVLEREVAANLASGATSRWFDFSLGWIHGDARLSAVIGNLGRVQKTVDEAGVKALDPANSVAVLTSEKATYYTGFDSSLNAQLVSRQYPELFRSGAGMDFYLLEDLEELPDYHAYIFLNALKLTDSQRRKIESLKKNGNLLIFCYGADLIGVKGIDLDAMGKLLGFPIEMVAERGKDSVKAKVGNVEAEYGYDEAAGPLLYPVKTSGMEILGKTANGRPGLVRVKKADHTIVYSSIPAIPARILRALLKDAGVRIYNPNEGDVTWASGELMSVHTLSGGERTFPAKGQQVKELLSGELLPVKSGTFQYTFPPESTAIFLQESTLTTK